MRRLGEADPAALERLRQTVGGHRARLRLDDEAVDVRFDPDGLRVEEPAGEPVDGEGETDRATVLDLLDGYLEVTDAILDGRLRVTGAVDEIARMFAAIEHRRCSGSRATSAKTPAVRPRLRRNAGRGAARGTRPGPVTRSSSCSRAWASCHKATNLTPGVSVINDRVAAVVGGWSWGEFPSRSYHTSRGPGAGRSRPRSAGRSARSAR